MDEIKPNMYVRTKYGEIARIDECKGKDKVYKNMEHYETDRQGKTGCYGSSSSKNQSHRSAARGRRRVRGYGEVHHALRLLRGVHAGQGRTAPYLRDRLETL